MVDYYSILSKAMSAPEAADPQWRHGVYDRARQMLVTQLQARQPPTPPRAIVAEQSALDAAIRRIEAETLRTGRDTMARDDRIGDIDIASDTAIEPERGPIARPLRFGSVSWIAVAVVAAVIAAGGYIFWVQHAHRSAATPVKTATPATPAAAPQPAATPAPAAKIATAKDGELAAGVDGGASYDDLPYVFRRQPTFYRTLQPVGTIIIDKLQHFLYLIRPNNVALRYGIGLGAQCTELVGLRHVASMAEWPPWQATPDMIERKLAKPGTLAGGAGNPLGARVMELDDSKSRINGTNAPATIGTTVIFGCIRLSNDDVADLYGRVKVGTVVLVD